MLIASLPPLHQQELVHQIISCPHISALRYNTGMTSAYPVSETVRQLDEIVQLSNKPVWIDLKGRQLRVVNWSRPPYGRILLNHSVSVEGVATVTFRGGDTTQVKFVRDNELFVDPPPRQALGEGQSLVIVGEHVTIDGYLTSDDIAFIRAASTYGLRRFMLSFVEHRNDIRDVDAVWYNCQNQKPTYVCKIESPAGMRFIQSRSGWAGCHLMAARDDLYATLGTEKHTIIEKLRHIVQSDSQAIAASQLFKSLEQQSEVALADFSDVALLDDMGYRHFMLSDGICQRHFATAIKAWVAISTNRPPTRKEPYASFLPSRRARLRRRDQRRDR